MESRHPRVTNLSVATFDFRLGLLSVNTIHHLIHHTSLFKLQSDVANKIRNHLLCFITIMENRRAFCFVLN